MFAWVRDRRVTIKLKTATSIAAVVVGACMGSAPAQAQLLGACPSIIMPPPCIIFDYKKLANWAQTHAQVLQQIDQVRQSIAQTQATVQGVGQTAQNLASINFQMPDLDTNASSILGGLPTSTGITALGQSYASKVFADASAGGGVDGAMKAHLQRRQMTAEAAADAYAYRIYTADQTGKSVTDVANLSKEMNDADTLQADWVANSHIRLAIIAAETQRGYLLSTYLKLKSATATLKTDASISWGAGTSGTMVPSTLTPVSDTITPKLHDLDALLAQASSLMASIQVVQMANTSITQLNAQLDDYNNTVAQNAALNAAFQSWAQQTSRHWSQIVNDTNTAMANKDVEYANDRALDINDPTNVYQFGRRFNADAMAQFATNEVDPRQFLGTWGDPIKGTLAQEIANYLTSGSLDDYLDGSDNDRFRDYVEGHMVNGSYVDGLYSLREEVAWKKSLIDGVPGDPTQPSVQDEIAQAQQQIADESSRQGFDVNTDSITAKLQDIVSQANALGQQIAASGDANAQATAASTLAQLQQVVGGGTGLPYVDPNSIVSIDASGNVQNDASGNAVVTDASTAAASTTTASSSTDTATATTGTTTSTGTTSAFRTIGTDQP